MENIDLEGRRAELEKVVGELTKVVYSHAFAVASLRYEFGMHYHVHDGQTLPHVLNTGDPLLKLVTSVSLLDTDVKPQIVEYERDPQAFLKSNYSDLFYWPWE